MDDGDDVNMIGEAMGWGGRTNMTRGKQTLYGYIGSPNTWSITPYTRDWLFRTHIYQAFIVSQRVNHTDSNNFIHWENR